MTKMKEASFCVYNGTVAAHGRCCLQSQQARERARTYPNLDLDTLTFLAVEDCDGDVAAAARQLINQEAGENRA